MSIRTPGEAGPVRVKLGGGHAPAVFIPHVFQSRQTYHLAIVAAAQVLVGLMVDGLAQEMDRSVHEREIYSTRMPRLKAVRHVVILVIAVGHGCAAVAPR